MADGSVVIDIILDDGTVAKGVANIDKKFGGLGKTSRNVARRIGEIAGAIGLVGLASKAINSVTKSIDGAISRYDTLNNFPRVMQQIGFSAEESEGAINRLSDGIQGLPTTLDDVAKTTQRIATLTGDLDGAVDTTLALNNAFIASGASTADAQRGLEQYVQMLSRGEVDLQSWRSLQETMGVALNDVAKAFGFAGASAQNDLYDALKSGEITFDEFNAKLIELSDGTNGFAERARTASGGIRTAWTNMNTAIVRGVTNIIEAIDGVLAKTPLQSIENIINRIGNAFNAFLTWIADGISSLAGPLENLSSMFEGSFSDMMPMLYSKGMEMITNLVQGISENATQFADTAVQMVQTWLENLATFYPLILEAGTRFLIALVTGLVQNLPVLFEAALNIVTAVIETIVNMLPSLINSGMQILLALINGIIQALPGLIDAVLEAVITIVNTVIDNLPQIIKAGIKVVFALIEGILDTLPDIIDAILDVVDALIVTIIDNLPLFITAAIDIILALIDGITKALPQIISALLTVLTRLIQTIVSNLPLFTAAAIQIIAALISGIIKAAPKIIKSFFSLGKDMAKEILGFDWIGIGKDIIGGLIRGIKNMTSRAIEAITGVVGGIVNKAKNLLKISSPSKLFEQYGKWTGEGLAKGIESMQKVAEKSSEKLGLGVDDALSSQLQIDSLRALIGYTANSVLSSLLPTNFAVQQEIIHKQANAGRYDDSRVIQLLKQLVEKDGNVYIDRERVGSILDEEQARRIRLLEGWVAID